MTTKLRMLSVSTAVVILALGIGISLLSAQDAEAQARNTKWVKGSWVQTSIAHNAEDHSAHQVANFFNPQDGYIYNGLQATNTPYCIQQMASLEE